MSSAFSPRIAKKSGLLITPPVQISNLRQMIVDLSAENAVYKKNRQELFKSHDEVQKANEVLQSGIAESQKVLSGLSVKMEKLNPKLDRCLKRRRIAMTRLRRYKSQIQKKKRSTKSDVVSDEIEKYDTLLFEMKNRVGELKGKRDSQECVVEQIKKLTVLRDDLSEMNERLRADASNYWNAIDLDALDIDDSLKKMFGDLQTQMELGESLRKELESVASFVREPDDAFYKAIARMLAKCGTIIEKLEKRLGVRPGTAGSMDASGKVSDLWSSYGMIDMSSMGGSQTSEAEILTLSARVSLLRKRVEKTERKLVVPVIANKSGTPKGTLTPRRVFGPLSPTGQKEKDDDVRRKPRKEETSEELEKQEEEPEKKRKSKRQRDRQNEASPKRGRRDSRRTKRSKSVEKDSGDSENEKKSGGKKKRSKSERGRRPRAGSKGEGEQSDEKGKVGRSSEGTDHEKASQSDTVTKTSESGAQEVKQGGDAARPEKSDDGSAEHVELGDDRKEDLKRGGKGKKSGKTTEDSAPERSGDASNAEKKNRKVVIDETASEGISGKKPRKIHSGSEGSGEEVSEELKSGSPVKRKRQNVSEGSGLDASEELASGSPVKRKRKKQNVSEGSGLDVSEELASGSPVRRKRKKQNVSEGSGLDVSEELASGSPVKRKRKRQNVSEGSEHDVSEELASGSPVKRKRKKPNVSEGSGLDVSQELSSGSPVKRKRQNVSEGSGLDVSEELASGSPVKRKRKKQNVSEGSGLDVSEELASGSPVKRKRKRHELGEGSASGTIEDSSSQSPSKKRRSKRASNAAAPEASSDDICDGSPVKKRKTTDDSLQNEPQYSDEHMSTPKKKRPGSHRRNRSRSVEQSTSENDSSATNSLQHSGKKRHKSQHHRKHSDAEPSEDNDATSKRHRHTPSPKRHRGHSSRKDLHPWKLPHIEVPAPTSFSDSGAKPHRNDKDETAIEALARDFGMDKQKILPRSASCPCLSRRQSHRHAHRGNTHSRPASPKKRPHHTEESIVDAHSDTDSDDVASKQKKHVRFAKDARPQSRKHKSRHQDSDEASGESKGRHETSEVSTKSYSELTLTSYTEKSILSPDSSVDADRDHETEEHTEVTHDDSDTEPRTTGGRILPAPFLCRHRVPRTQRSSALTFASPETRRIKLSEQRRHGHRMISAIRSSQDVPVYSEQLPDALEASKLLSRSEETLLSPSKSGSPSFDRRVYPTEATGNIFISREALDPDFAGFGRRQRKVSQTKWAYSLLQNAIANQLSRTRMQVAVAAAHFQLSQLKDEITTLKDDLLLAQFEHQGRQSIRSFTLKVVSMYIPPAASNLTPYRRRMFGTQTRTTSAQLADVDVAIEENNVFLAKHVEAQQDKMLADTHLPALEQALQEYKRKNDRLFYQVDKMKRRLGRVGPGKKLRKETRHRIRYEKAMNEDREKSLELDERIKSQSQEIDDLKKRIQDQRELHNTLRAKIDEERKSPLPNVMKLHKQLDGYKSFTKSNNERFQMLTILEQNYDQRIEDMSKIIKGVPDLDMTVKAIKSHVESMKAIVNKNGKSVTTQAEIKELETRASEVASDYDQLQLKEKRLITRVKVLVTKMLNYKLSVPQSRCLDIAQGFT